MKRKFYAALAIVAAGLFTLGLQSALVAQTPTKIKVAGINAIQVLVVVNQSSKVEVVTHLSQQRGARRNFSERSLVVLVMAKATAEPGAVPAIPQIADKARRGIPVRRQIFGKRWIGAIERCQVACR